MRKAVFAGSFYPKSEPALKKAIESCFLSDFGPGSLPSKVRKAKPVLAVLAPHAGYQYSGPAAAWSYKAIAESPLPDVFIILAPNHNSGRSGICMETFLTPFGEVRMDQEFAKELAAKGTVLINDEIHIPEHSIEVQLPFLQYAAGANATGIKILPILVSSDLDLSKAALDIKETIIDLDRSVVFVVSSDFTHYGKNYQYLPFFKDVKESLEELDTRAFDIIKTADYTGFEEFIDETEDTICGFYPILLFLRTVKFKEAILEKYYVSGDIIGDYSNSVSYASFVFR